MTEAQQQARDRIGELMREHFQAGVVIFDGEVNDDQNEITHIYHGGYSSAVGLVEIVRRKLIQPKPEELDAD